MREKGGVGVSVVSWVPPLLLLLFRVAENDLCVVLILMLETTKFDDFPLQ